MFLDTRVGPDIVTLASLALVVLPVDSPGEDTVADEVQPRFAEQRSA